MQLQLPPLGGQGSHLISGQVGHVMATLVTFWGAIFGPMSTLCAVILNHVSRHTPQGPLPGPEGETQSNQNNPKTQKTRQNANLAVETKREQKLSQNPPSKRSHSCGPAATTSFAAAQVEAPPSRAIEMTMFLRKGPVPCAESGVGGIVANK